MRVFLAFALCALGTGERFSGTIDSPDGFAFIGKFVIDTTPDGGTVAGGVDVSLSLVDTREPIPEGVELWLYDDEDDSWPSIYQSGKTCEEVRQLAKNYKEKNNPPISTKYQVKFQADGTFHEPKIGITQKARERYWFAVLGKCTGDQKISNIHYETHWTNYNRSPWNIEFGSNQAGIQTLYLMFFLFYLPFTLVHFYGVFQLSKKLEYVHPMVKLFALVVLLQLAVITANLSHWGAFVHNGVGMKGALATGEIANLVCRSIFIMILMLMAKGWTISGEELTGKYFVIGVVSGYTLLDGLILLWKYAVADPAATDTELGVKIFLYIILVIWFAFAVWFCHAIYHSYANEDNPVKKALYRNMALVYGPWFFGLPLVTVLTVNLSPWTSAKIVETVTLLLSTAAYVVMSFLLWPSRAEEYFNISTPDVMKAQIDTYEQL